jgi:hypothetical protein
MPNDRSIIDAISGGALVDKTPEATCQLISNMATNSKQFGTREDFSNKRVNEVKVCNICSLQGHTSDMCPTMLEDYIE